MNFYSKVPFICMSIFAMFAVSSSDLNTPDEQAINFIVEPGEEFPGGMTTHTKPLDHNSFSHPSANLDFEQGLLFSVGNGFFKRQWVTSPSSTQAADGLGPLFNSRACQSCHIKDGRGHPPLENESHSESLLIRISIPPQNDQQKALLASGKINAIPDPVYGGQLQSLSVPGVKGEGLVGIDYQPITRKLKQGQITLQKPIYSVRDSNYGPLHSEIRLSPRVAPQMIGLGLLEAVSEQTILSLADPDDLDGDGVSGKANWAWSNQHQRLMLGRFGHKAGVPTINDQNQNAFFGDIGLSVPLHTNPVGDCTEHQADCFKVGNGASPQYDNLEVHAEITDLVLFYTQNLAVPKRRNFDHPDTLAGKKHFHEAGCASCHQPRLTTPTTADSPITVSEHFLGQTIWPYTDLLLHDLGPDLADHSPEAMADGFEWRTAPLWGIGLTPLVNGHTRFLHDGRAQSIEEAILWHGGEAESAREYFIHLGKSKQKQLLHFVESL